MWTSEWPTEQGYYWFYGWCFCHRDRPPGFHCVEVYRTAIGFRYATGGHFLYETEGASGIWQPVKLPNLPANLPISFFETGN